MNKDFLKDKKISSLIIIILAIFILFFSQYLSRILQLSVYRSGYVELATIVYIVANPVFVSLGIFIVSRFILKTSLKDLYINNFRLKPKWIVISLLFPIVFYGLLYLFLRGNIAFQNNIRLNLSLIILSYLSGFSIAIAEELVCRGLLLSSIKKIYNSKIAIGLSAIVFSLIHIVNFVSISNPTIVVIQMVYTLVFGITFALITLETRSVWDAVLLHGNINGLLNIISVSNSNGHSSDLVIWIINVRTNTIALTMGIIFLILNAILILSMTKFRNRIKMKFND